MKRLFKILIEFYKFYDIIKYLDDGQMLVIYGLRRTGKTTIMYQIIDYLLKKKVNRNNILYFSFDYTNIELKDIISDYENFLLIY